jgi:hypothetical protein
MHVEQHQLNEVDLLRKLQNELTTGPGRIANEDFIHLESDVND